MSSALTPLITLRPWDGGACLSDLGEDRHVLLLLDSEDSPEAFGCRHDDFSCATLLFRSAGHVAPLPCPAALKGSTGRVLTFTRDLSGDTPLESRLEEYTFGRYAAREALHLACRERHVVGHILDELQHEMEADIDDFTRRILTDHLQLLFDHVSRFYHRQFITRENCNAAMMGKVNWFLTTYFDTGRVPAEGFPTADDAAEVLHVSTPYFLDLLQHVTGRTWDAYLFNARLEHAKRMLQNGKGLADIARCLGFRSTSGFSALFRRLTGLTPTQFRHTS